MSITIIARTVWSEKLVHFEPCCSITPVGNSYYRMLSYTCLTVVSPLLIIYITITMDVLFLKSLLYSLPLSQWYMNTQRSNQMALPQRVDTVSGHLPIPVMLFMATGNPGDLSLSKLSSSVFTQKKDMYSSDTICLYWNTQSPLLKYRPFCQVKDSVINRMVHVFIMEIPLWASILL